MNKKGLITAACAVAAAILIVVLVIMPNVNKETVKNDEIATTQPVKNDSNETEAPSQSESEDKTEEKVNTEKPQNEPVADKKATFMFFMTNEDEKNKDLNSKLDELKREYTDRVEFDIRNVDKDKELLKNFPVEGSTPALIMLKPNGDIVNMLLSIKEYDNLKSVIESAFAE